MANEVAQWEQFHNVLNGKQNFCIVEERKAPVLYTLLYEADYNDFPNFMFVEWESPDGAEIVVGKPGFYKAYHDLLESCNQYERYEFQIAMGTLLGYDVESCIEFAAQPPDCGCSKCGGPETDMDEIKRKRWIADGCPHVLKPAKVEMGPLEYEGTRPKQALTYKGKPYGTLYHPDPELIKNSPAIQPWSKPQ